MLKRWSMGHEGTDLFVVEDGEDRRVEAAGRTSVEFDGDSLAVTPRVDAQRVVDGRILRMVEVHDGAVEREPLVTRVATAGHCDRVRHVGAHISLPSGASRRTPRSASIHLSPCRRDTTG